ncbi:MAG TPA: FHA domain-containing protein [Usitatibacter sp.]|jgi:pSer/pThr/pTyr-binding forkhead associated (FHA) protein|nr:FHA domain-containing protein [Usitatibacter sp.]
MAARVVLSFDDEIVREVELTRPVTVVGRHPDCDIVIEHAAVSGRHMLFRVVNHTVYVEDLASTNGTKVNGIPTAHQVVHHLDLVEVGRHKIHFFDDAMMAGGVSSLESTVLTDYERTMLAQHVPAASRAPAPAPANDGDLSRTMAIQRDPTIRLAGSEPDAAVAVAAQGTLALQVLSGERAGQTIALDRANTMIGVAGGDSALVVRRGQGVFLARFGGQRPPRLNRTELAGTHPIGPHDLIEVGGSVFEVIQVAG